MLLPVKSPHLGVDFIFSHVRDIPAHVLLQPYSVAGLFSLTLYMTGEDRVVIVAAVGQPTTHDSEVDLPDSHGRPGIDRARLFHKPGLRQGVLDSQVRRAIENRRHRSKTQVMSGPTKVGLQHLAQVHAGGHADWVEDDVHRRAIGQEGHILFRHDLGDDALVAVASRHLVALGYLAGLSDPQTHHLVDARRKLVLVSPRQHLHANNLAAFAVRHTQRRVLHVPGLLTEYSPQELLLGAQLGLTLGGNFAHQDVSGADLRPHANDAVLVQVSQAVLAHVGYVSCYLLRTQLGVPGLHLVLLDVNGGEAVLLDELFAKDYRVLEVVALPAHEGHQDVLTQCKLALSSR